MWWSTSKSGCYVSKASNVGSFLGARMRTYAGRAEQSLVWSSGCNIVSEEALITASFAWLHLSYPSILLTVQKFTQIIMINTNLSSGKQKHCSCYIWTTPSLLKDSGTLEKLWIVPELFIWPSLIFLQLCQENSGPQSDERWPNRVLWRLKHLEWVHHHQVITGAPEGTWTSEDLKSCSWDCTSKYVMMM